MSSTFGLVTISGCAPYAAVNVRLSSFPSCRLSSLKQSVTPRHVRTVTSCFLQSSKDPSLQTQFSLTILLCPRSDTRHYGHAIVVFTYLLTYLRSPVPILTGSNEPSCHPLIASVSGLFYVRSCRCCILLAVLSAVSKC